MLSRFLQGRWLAVASLVAMFVVGGLQSIGWLDAQTAVWILAALVGTGAAGQSAIAPNVPPNGGEK